MSCNNFHLGRSALQVLLAEFNVSTQSKKNLMTFSSLTKNLSYFRRKLSIVSLL